MIERLSDAPAAANRLSPAPGQRPRIEVDASVHADRLAGDGAGGVAREVGDEVGDLAGSARRRADRRERLGADLVHHR